MAEKKVTWKTFAAIAVLFIAFGGYAYYDIVLKAQLNGALLLDNPTEEKISVKIDDKVYSVPAGEYIKVDLEEGNHSLTCEKYGVSNETFKIEDLPYGVINPTKSKYYLYKKRFVGRFQALSGRRA